MPTPPFPAYTPGSPRRRDRARALLAQALTVKNVLLFLLATVVAFGWTITSPGKRIDGLDVRVTRTERRIDTLAEAQRFTNYMLCVNARRTDPASAPPDCIPIIEARRGK